MSQSPSLRGSGRFRRAQRISPPSREVSIPFIAGQWSLPADASAGGGVCGTGLNPLHCGAVVASRKAGSGGAESRRVSIPFIAGQWSLPGGAAGVSALARRVSIPFIAGQWSLRAGGSWCAMIKNLSQSPSLRGSGRFGSAGAEGSGGASSQSPSLRGSGRFSSRTAGGGKEEECLNPLHCGAVVASVALHRAPPGPRRRVSIPFIAGQWSLLLEDWLNAESKLVSIPFIAGQWSLLLVPYLVAFSVFLSQSPSLRGSGRFDSLPRDTRRMLRRVSIPFIAGQWSLQKIYGYLSEVSEVSQSPSLRGSGRFGLALTASRAAVRAFQSPSLRGSGRFRYPPFSGPPRPSGFNPLHCGAVVASVRHWVYPAALKSMFQSPSLRGSGRFQFQY